MSEHDVNADEVSTSGKTESSGKSSRKAEGKDASNPSATSFSPMSSLGRERPTGRQWYLNHGFFNIGIIILIMNLSAFLKMVFRSVFRAKNGQSKSSYFKGKSEQVKKFHLKDF